MKRWIWAIVKLVPKYLFRLLTFILCFGKYCRPNSLHSTTCTRMSRTMNHPPSSPAFNPREIFRRRRESSTLRLPTRFIGEIHLVLSALVIISCIGTLVNVSLKVGSADSHEAMLLGKGFILFTSVTFIISLMDVGLSFFLIHAAKDVNLDKCLFWYRSTLSILVMFTLMTICFGVLLKSGLVVLGLLPSIIFKPFSLWVVGGFIEEIYDCVRKTGFLQPIVIVPVEGPSDSISYDYRSNDRTTAFQRQPSTSTATTSIGSTTEYDNRDEMKKKASALLKKKQSQSGSDSDDIGIGGELVTLTRIKNLSPE